MSISDNQSIHTDNLDVVLALIARELTPELEWFAAEGKTGNDALKEQIQFFATTFAGLISVKNKSNTQLTAEQIASMFKWQD